MQRNKNHPLRRLAAAAVSAVMLLSLTACSKAPDEPTRPPHLITDPDFTRPQEPAVTETVPSQSLETTAPKVEIDYSNLVTDAYRFALRDNYGTELCYHIPQINLDSCALLNAEIYRTLSELINQDVHEAMREYDEILVGDVFYVWGHKNDAVSILVVADSPQYEWTDYSTYYLSTKTGEKLGKAGLLDAFGLSEQAFHDHVYAQMKAYWDQELRSEAYATNDYLTQIGHELAAQTLDEENIHAAIPFLREDGRLAFIITLYVPAGAGNYPTLYDYETGEQLNYYRCDQDHSAEISVSADDPLQYFIENCDRMYFTKADIQDFDEEMCLYARNAIYAKSGWIFSSANLRSYFDRYSWYRPTVTADAFTEDLLNSCQIANRDLIVNHENALKGEDQDTLQYFIENCDRRYFTAAEIADLDEEELVYARNAVYAKSGRIFSMEKLSSYFAKYSWYSPTIAADDFTEDMLNQYQAANRDLIVARENSLKGITPEEAYAIACAYWDYQEGDIADETGFELYLVDDGTTEHNGTTYYSFRLRWLVVGEDGSSWLSTLDQVYINAQTGECSYSIYS